MPPAVPRPPAPARRVGQALLRGQWQESVRLLLTPRADCPRPEQVEASRLYLEEGDVEGALARMPRFLVAEPTLLQVGGGWTGSTGWEGAARGRTHGRPGGGAKRMPSACQGRHPASRRAVPGRRAGPDPNPPCPPLHPTLQCEQGLKQHGPNGFLNALMALPRNLRSIYIHAYQSYLVGGWRGRFGWFVLHRQACLPTSLT